MSDTLTPEERAYLIEHHARCAATCEDRATWAQHYLGDRYTRPPRMQASAHRKMVEMLKGGE